MEDNMKLLEPLIERATDYGKTSYELAKLKFLDKTSDAASSLIPHSIVLILFTSFLFFFNLGLALYLGKILGEPYYGFFVVAGFYCFTGAIMHFFMHKWLKTSVRNYIIKQFLK
jgi:hypothetical protein